MQTAATALYAGDTRHHITVRSASYPSGVNGQRCTAPLTSDEAEWIDQLFTSREVMRFEPNPCDNTEPLLLAPVLITDTDCEISLEREKPNTAKFTWRYADNRPVVRLSASPGIFRSEYTLPSS